MMLGQYKDDNMVNVRRVRTISRYNVTCQRSQMVLDVGL